MKFDYDEIEVPADFDEAISAKNKRRSEFQIPLHDTRGTP